MSMLSIQFSIDQDRYLREFLRSAYVEQNLTDCNLYCWAEDGVSGSSQKPQYCTYRCHRLVLSAYSGFFRQCFLDTANSNITTLFLDIEPRTLENILRLIYTGQIEINQSEIELFFNAATKLSLKDFKIANTKEVLPAVNELNHLKRRLTQDEAILNKLSKQAKADGKIAYSTIDQLSDETRDELQSSEKGELSNMAAISDYKMALAAAAAAASASVQEPPPPPPVTVGPDNGNGYTCTICHKHYSYKISLNKHIKSAHSN